MKYKILHKEVNGVLMFFDLRRKLDEHFIHSVLLTLNLDTGDYKVDEEIKYKGEPTKFSLKENQVFLELVKELKEKYVKA